MDKVIAVDSKTLHEVYLPCIGRSKFYELIHEPGFPKISMGRKYIYDLERVREYLNTSRGGEVIGTRAL